MVSEVEEVAKGAIVILYMLFEICVNLLSSEFVREALELSGSRKYAT